jgi:antagonist of KipI
MGIRLEGGALARLDAREPLTEGVALGAIQVASGGGPIVLFVDHQTTGGYPKIANVIAADLPRLGRLRPRDRVRFRRVELAAALRALREREEALVGILA